MRLSQLARQVSKTSKELIVFLHSRGIKSYTSSNAKIDPDHVRLIQNHFGPESISSPEDTISAGKKDREFDPSLHDEQPLKPEISQKKTSKQAINLPEPEETEIIRAPKIKLQGVKVVGKIELPEKPVKVTESKPTKEENLENPTLKTGLERPGKSTHFNKHKTSRYPKNKQSSSYLEKQKKEELRREKEKKERLRKEKEKKRIHYQKNVQSKIQPGRLKKKQEIKNSEKQNHNKPAPVNKNPIKRFWAWLNGAYDE